LSAEESLRRLQTDTLDIFLLHRYDEDHPLEDALEALDLLVREGKVRFVGCSNFSALQITTALRIQRDCGWAQFSVVQPMYSLIARMIEQDILPLCRTRHLGVMSYSPLAAGFLTGKYHMDEPAPAGTRFDIKPGHRNHYFFHRSFELVAKLQVLAAEAAVSPIQLALAWVFSQPDLTTVLIGARNIAHVEQAWQAWSDREALRPYVDRLSTLTREFVSMACCG
jgi:aryl-alcohol dehydrogenase-like predicted oxidoreductase